MPTTRREIKRYIRREVRDRAVASGAGYTYAVQADPLGATSATGIFNEQVAREKGIAWNGQWIDYQEALRVVRPGDTLTVFIYKQRPGASERGALVDALAITVPHGASAGL